MTLSTPQTLVTKVSIPAVHRTWVERPRLSQRLDLSLRFPLTLICAPAGSGKTTAVTGWHVSQAAQTPLVWVSLDEDDNDFTQFMLYITTAINAVKPGIFEQALSLAGTASSPRMIATILINHLHDLAADFVLVLDDYHLIHNEQIHELITLLVERMPPPMHLIIVTREDPPLPIGRWRANDQIVEIREAELRFSLDESRQFFHSAFGIHLSDDDLEVLQRRIEGWATGLKLAALALRGQTDTSKFIQAFSGSHRYVIDYLMEEVFEHQPEDIQQFLLETAFLREMNAELCNSVTQRSDLQEILENFVQANLFTIALSENNDWFRYHHLFADTLQNRLRRKSEKRMLEIHQRAAHWYRAHNQHQATLHHLFEAHAYGEVAQFINRHGFDFVESDGYEKPLTWIRRIPPEALTQFPDVLLLAAFLYTKTNRAHLPEVRLWVDQAQAAVSGYAGQDISFLQAKINIVESILAEDVENDRARSQALLEQAMPYVRHDPDWYTVAAMQRAWSLIMESQIEAALAFANEIIRLAEQNRRFNALMEAYKISSLALQYAGRFGAAMQVLEMAIVKARDWGRFYHLELGLIYFNVARIALLRGEMKLAEEVCHQTLTITETFDVTALSIPVCLHLAEVQCNLGKIEEAKATLLKARLAFQQHPELESAVEQSTQAFVSTLTGDIESARQWALSSGFDPRPDPAEIRQFFQEGRSLLLHLQFLHVLLADLQHNPQPLSDWGSVLLWAETIRQISIERNIPLWEVRATAILAVAQAASGQLDDAYAALHHGLIRAEPEQLVYPFIACGAPLRTLLQNLHQRGQGTTLSTRILQLNDPASNVSQRPAPLGDLEPLTDREFEILQLVNDGYSNNEIAQQLYISLATVKRHLANVFIKLGADNRTHALALAREYGIL